MNLKKIKHGITAGISGLFNQHDIRNKKVFAIGFNKTGTSSIHELFLSLGLKSYHGTKWRGCDDMKLLKNHDAFCDGIPKDLPKLDRLFPESKFVLQVRDLDSWIFSRLSHIERKKMVGGFKPGRPGWDDTEFAIRSWIEQRNQYHLYVLSYFSKRPNDFLIVNFIRNPNAATKISKFIGFKGKFERPKKNVNPKKARSSKHVAMISKCFSELKINEEEKKFDIYCPSLLESNESINFPPDSSSV